MRGAALSFVVLAGVLAASVAHARPGCRRLCREAIEDCRVLAGQQAATRRSCRKTVRAQCRRDDGASCRAASGRARLCRERCAERARGCDATPSMACGDVERRCRTSDAGLAACQEAAAAFVDCQRACVPIHDSCLGARDLQTCNAFVNTHCRSLGPDYCRAEGTANGCNRLVARDLRDEPAVALASDCILVSRGTIVVVEERMIFSSLDDLCASGEPALYGTDCFTALLHAIVGGSPPSPDPRSPFAAAVGQRAVRFAEPGTFGYWGTRGVWGAVIVDDH